MNKRPFFLLFPTLFLLVDPILKLYIYSLIYRKSIGAIIDAQMVNMEHFVPFFLIGPVASFILYKTKWWTPILYLPLIGWQFFLYLMEMKQAHLSGDSTAMVFWSVLLFFAGICIIFPILPKMFILYFNPHLRWWEHQIRFQINLDCLINNTFKGRIENISEGGAFISVAESTPVDDILKLKFSGKDQTIKVSGKIVYRFAGDKNVVGYGIQFIDMDSYLKASVRELIADIKKQNFEVVR